MLRGRYALIRLPTGIDWLKLLSAARRGEEPRLQTPRANDVSLIATLLPCLLVACLSASCFAQGTPAASSAQTAPPAPATAAETSASTATRTEPLLLPGDYTLLIAGRAWYAAPGGDVTFAGGPSIKTNLNFFDIDEPQLSPAGEVRIKADKFIFAISGAGFDASSNATARFARTLGPLAVPAGAALRTELTYSTVQALGGYELYDHRFDAAAHNALKVYLLAGGRVNDMSLQVNRPGIGSVAADITGAEINLGALVELTLLERIFVDLSISGGAGTDSSSVDLTAAFRYRVLDWLTLDIGYRILVNPLSDGDTELDTSLAGLLFGVSIRF